MKATGLGPGAGDIEGVRGAARRIGRRGERGRERVDVHGAGAGGVWGGLRQGLRGGQGESGKGKERENGQP